MPRRKRTPTCLAESGAPKADNQLLRASPKADINVSHFQEVTRLLAPHPPPRRIDTLHQIDDVGFGKSSRKISSGCGIRYAISSQCIEEGFVIPAQFNILKAFPAGKNIVGNI